MPPSKAPPKQPKPKKSKNAVLAVEAVSPAEVKSETYPMKSERIFKGRGQQLSSCLLEPGRPWNSNSLLKSGLRSSTAIFLQGALGM